MACIAPTQHHALQAQSPNVKVELSRPPRRATSKDGTDLGEDVMDAVDVKTRYSGVVGLEGEEGEDFEDEETWDEVMEDLEDPWMAFPSMPAEGLFALLFVFSAPHLLLAVQCELLQTCSPEVRSRRKARGFLLLLMLRIRSSGQHTTASKKQPSADKRWLRS